MDIKVHLAPILTELAKSYLGTVLQLNIFLFPIMLLSSNFHGYLSQGPFLGSILHTNLLRIALAILYT